jgi:hypothetical protein
MELPPRKTWPFAHYYQKLDPNEGGGRLRTETKVKQESHHHNVLV